MNKFFKKFLNVFSFINNKYSSFVKNHKYLYILPKNFFLTSIFFFVLFISVLSLINNNTVVHKNGELSGYTNGILYKSKYINIDTKNVDRIDSIGLYFATYARKNNSQYNFKIYKNNKIVFCKKIYSKDLKDNSLYLVKTNLKTINKNVEYKIELEPLKVKKGNEIALIKDVDGIAYSIVNKSDFYYLCLTIFIIYIIIFSSINVLINSNKIQNEKKYLLIMLMYLIPILFIIPPYEVPDERYHFYKTYRVSQYSFEKSRYENMKKKKIEVPKNYECLYYSYSNNENINSTKDITNCFKSKTNIKTNLDDGDSINRLFVTIPGAIGIKLVDLFTNSPLIIFYAGRLFSFIVSFLILYQCLKIIPYNKKIVLLIIFLPMFIQQMVSYSYDSILQSLCLLLISLFLNYSDKKEMIRTKDLIIFGIITLAIMIIKVPYCLFSFMILFINKDKFGNKNKKIFKLFMFFVSIFIAYIIVQKFENYGINSYMSNTSSVNKGNSLYNLIKSPYNTLLMVARTFKYELLNYLYGIVGVFGWLHYHLNHIYIWIYYFVIFLIVFSEENNLSKRIKIIMLLISFMIIGSIFLAMYLSWTPINSYTIVGVQGRYFIPVLIPLLISLTSNKKKIDVSTDFVYSFINITMLLFITTLLVSFY